MWAAHIILAAERADQLSQKQPLAKVVAESLGKEGFDPRVVDSFQRAEYESSQNRVQMKLYAVRMEAGMFLVVAKQDATGGRALTLASGYALSGGKWSTAANAVNLLWITSDGSGTALDVVIAQRGV